jgi:hypothetical protein
LGILSSALSYGSSALLRFSSSHSEFDSTPTNGSGSAALGN